jgi:hypothetical protein
MIRYASGSTGLQAWLTQAQAHWLESSWPHQTACQGSPANEVELRVIGTQFNAAQLKLGPNHTQTGSPAYMSRRC